VLKIAHLTPTSKTGNQVSVMHLDVLVFPAK